MNTLTYVLNAVPLILGSIQESMKSSKQDWRTIQNIENNGNSNLYVRIVIMGLINLIIYRGSWRRSLMRLGKLKGVEE